MGLRNILIEKLLLPSVILSFLLCIGCSINKSQVQNEEYLCSEFKYLVEAITNSEVMFVGSPYDSPSHIDNYCFTVYQVSEFLYSSKELEQYTVIENGRHVPEKPGIRVYSHLDEVIFNSTRDVKVLIDPEKQYFIFIDLDKKIIGSVPFTIPMKRGERYSKDRMEEEMKYPTYFEYSELGTDVRRIQEYSTEMRELVTMLIQKTKKITNCETIPLDKSEVEVIRGQ